MAFTKPLESGRIGNSLGVACRVQRETLAVCVWVRRIDPAPGGRRLQSPVQADARGTDVPHVVKFRRRTRTTLWLRQCTFVGPRGPALPAGRYFIVVLPRFPVLSWYVPDFLRQVAIRPIALAERHRFCGE